MRRERANRQLESTRCWWFLPKPSLHSPNSSGPFQLGKPSRSDLRPRTGGPVVIRSASKQIPAPVKMRKRLPRLHNDSPTQRRTQNRVVTSQTPGSRASTMPVRFEFHHPTARSVSLAASFNNWNPSATPLVDLGGGRWLRLVWLPRGRYEYLFVADGRWFFDPHALDYSPNVYGTMNAAVEVRESIGQCKAPPDGNGMWPLRTPRCCRLRHRRQMRLWRSQ